MNGAEWLVSGWVVGGHHYGLNVVRIGLQWLRMDCGAYGGLDHWLPAHKLEL